MFNWIEIWKLRWLVVSLICVKVFVFKSLFYELFYGIFGVIILLKIVFRVKTIPVEGILRSRFNDINVLSLHGAIKNLIGIFRAIVSDAEPHH